MAVVKLLAVNQHLIGHGKSKCLLFNFLTFHFCHLKSAQNPAPNIVSDLAMLCSLFPQPPFCELDFLPQPCTKSCLDVSCSFLQTLWEDVWQPLLRPSHLAANTPAFLKTWPCQTHTAPGLCCFLSSSASVHTGTLLAPLTHQPYCRLPPKIWDIPIAAAPHLPQNPSWKCSKHEFRLVYCLLHPPLRKAEYKYHDC